MAHPATRKNDYWAQLGILALITGVGFVFAAVISSLPLIISVHLKAAEGSARELMKKILVPENANMLRLVQFLSTLFLFFIPAWLYARISHVKPLTHLGFTKKVNMAQTGIVIAIMIACLPLVGALSELTESLPFSKATFEKFKAAEEEYNEQIGIIGKMDNFPEFILSLFMLAILPALFEEVMFRGAVQNLFSRWWKMPILAIIVTSILFSAVHFSYLGFLSRAALGFVLGWMFYRTGNIWLNIIAHAANNTIALTALYIAKQQNPKADISSADPHIPMWWGLIAIAAVYGLFVAFESINKKQIDNPGAEVLIEYEDVDKPSWMQQPPNKDTFS
jgi:membrane protease YdiL (CAAX protease family)